MIKIFVINLKTDYSRRMHMEEIATQNNLVFQYIDALDGTKMGRKELYLNYDRKSCLATIHRELGPREIGCALSHRIIYKKIIDNKIEKALILEDDIEIRCNIEKLFDELKNIPDHVECILLGYHNEIKKDKNNWYSIWNSIKLNDEYKLKRFTKLAHGAFAYYLTLSGAIKLYKATNHLDRPIDHYTGDERFLNVYGIYPRCFFIFSEYFENTCLEKERKERITIKEKNHFYKMALELRLWLRRFIKQFMPIKKYNI